MGKITTELINSLVSNRPKIFIETGTFKGGIPQMMLDDGTFNQWNKIYTIELNPEMCKIASRRYSLYEIGDEFDRNTNEKDETFDGRKEFFDGKLVLICGDSSKKLKEILDEISERCVFWLDAHGGAKDGYMSGDNDCPLLSELRIIRDFKITDHIITIDDVDMFGTVELKGDKVICDYSDITLNQVEDLIFGINSEYKIDIVTPFGQKMLIAKYEKDLIIKADAWWNK